MTRDREFKTTPITECVCSPKAQSEHRQNSSPDSRSLYSKWHVHHLRSPPFPHKNSLFLNQLEQERGGTSICCTTNYSKRVDFFPQMNEVLICSYHQKSHSWFTWFFIMVVTHLGGSLQLQFLRPPQREKLWIRELGPRGQSLGEVQGCRTEFKHVILLPLGCHDSKQETFNFYSSSASGSEINGMVNTILLREQTELLFHQEWKRCFLAADVPK